MGLDILKIAMPASSLVLRRGTATLRTLPNIFILGATKAGSSSLTSMLWNHPSHVAPFAKELMYLQKLPEFQSNYEYFALAAFLWGRYHNGHATFSWNGYRKFFPLKTTLAQRKIQGKAPGDQRL